MCTVDLSSEHSHSQNRQCTCNITLQCVHKTVVAVVKQFVLRIMSVCLCSCLSFLAWKSRLLCHIILASVASLTSPYFSIYLINGTVLGGGEVIEHKMCILTFSTTFVSSTSHSEKI